MATLYTLTQDLQQLQNLIETGDYTEEQLADTMESLNLALEDKLEGYAMVIRNIKSDIDGLKAEEKRLKERRESLENGVKRMKEAMQESLVATGQKRVKTAKFTVSLRKSTSVNIVDENLIPDEFVKVTKTISKADLTKRLEESEVPGASLVENESLQIR